MIFITNLAFFYFDPPYYTEKGEWGYAPTKPEEVANFLKKIKGKWILSYENTRAMRKHFKDKKYKIKTIKTAYELSGTRQGTSEILVKNF